VRRSIGPPVPPARGSFPPPMTTATQSPPALDAHLAGCCLGYKETRQADGGVGPSLAVARNNGAGSEGQRSTAEMSFDGKFCVEITADLRNDWSSVVELTHATRDPRGDGRYVTTRVRPVRTVPRFGGYRWWFLCPRTACRSTKLFLPNGGQYFFSRRAYRLAYDSENEDSLDRLRRKAARLSYQLGERSWSFGSLPPTKPKWMRRPTCERKIAEWQSVTDAARAELERWAEGMRHRLRKHAPRRSDRPKLDARPLT
jgi:hypothetical protein